MSLIFLALVSATASAAIRMVEVERGLFRGPRPAARDYAEMAARGIKTVLSLQGGDYSGNRVIGFVVPIWERGETPRALRQARHLAEAAGLKYLNYPINSLGAITSNEFEEILNHLLDPKLRPMIVHCARGVDRTGWVMVLKRILHDNWTHEDAFAEMVRHGRNRLHRLVTFQLDRHIAGVVATRKCQARLLIDDAAEDPAPD